ncbi:hypothetical protein B484DRAFT_424067 [Ochromonadaceae sp. CCMP2298]|nr:hypothetical protein B484DRAFT_424067 [Ochromonadaceae sp. CCMP2298]
MDTGAGAGTSTGIGTGAGTGIGTGTGTGTGTGITIGTGGTGAESITPELLRRLRSGAAGVEDRSAVGEYLCRLIPRHWSRGRDQDQGHGQGQSHSRGGTGSREGRDREGKGSTGGVEGADRDRDRVRALVGSCTPLEALLLLCAALRGGVWADLTLRLCGILAPPCLHPTIGCTAAGLGLRSGIGAGADAEGRGKGLGTGLGGLLGSQYCAMQHKLRRYRSLDQSRCRLMGETERLLDAVQACTHTGTAASTGTAAASTLELRQEETNLGTLGNHRNLGTGLGDPLPRYAKARLLDNLWRHAELLRPAPAPVYRGARAGGRGAGAGSGGRGGLAVGGRWDSGGTGGGNTHATSGWQGLQGAQEQLRGALVEIGRRSSSEVAFLKWVGAAVKETQTQIYKSSDDVVTTDADMPPIPPVLTPQSPRNGTADAEAAGVEALEEAEADTAEVAEEAAAAAAEAAAAAAMELADTVGDSVDMMGSLESAAVGLLDGGLLTFAELAAVAVGVDQSMAQAGLTTHHIDAYCAQIGGGGDSRGGGFWGNGEQKGNWGWGTAQAAVIAFSRDTQQQVQAQTQAQTQRQTQQQQQQHKSKPQSKQPTQPAGPRSYS